jgi:hypothetical protein
MYKFFQKRARAVIYLIPHIYILPVNTHVKSYTTCIANKNSAYILINVHLNTAIYVAICICRCGSWE